MGDKIRNNKGVVINRSTINNSFNRNEEKLDKSDMDLLAKITTVIKKTENADAIENIQDFHEELGKEEPKTSRLKAFWSGVTNVLPALLTYTDKVIALIEKVGKVME